MLWWPSSVLRTPLIRTVARCSEGFPDLPSVPSSCLQEIRHRPKERSKHRVIERSAALSYGAASAGLFTAELKPSQTGRWSGRVGAGRLGTFAVVRRIRPPGPAPPDDGQVGTNLRRMRALYGVEDRDRTEIKAAAPKILKSAPYLLLETHTPTGLTLSVLDSWESIRDRKPLTRIPRGSLDNAIASLGTSREETPRPSRSGKVAL